MDEQDIYAVIRSVKRKLEKVNLGQIVFVLEPVGDGFAVHCWWKDEYLAISRHGNIYNPTGKAEASHLEEGLIEICLEFVKESMLQVDKADKLEFVDEPDKTGVHYTSNEGLPKGYGLPPCFKELDW